MEEERRGEESPDSRALTHPAPPAERPVPPALPSLPTQTMAKKTGAVGGWSERQGEVCELSTAVLMTQ